MTGRDASCALIATPPLRERPEDIPALTEHFLRSFRTQFNRPALTLTDDARHALQHHAWLGNVRELRNTLHRATALATADEIDATLLLPNSNRSAMMTTTSATASPSSTVAVTSEASIRSETTASFAAPNPLNAALTLEELERRHILRVLAEARDNRERAAAILGISARTLYRKLREYEA